MCAIADHSLISELKALASMAQSMVRAAEDGAGARLAEMDRDLRTAVSLIHELIANGTRGTAWSGGDDGFDDEFNIAMG